jgi:hypothetical protein
MTNAYLQFGNHLLALAKPLDSITNHLINNRLCWDLLVDDSGGLTHQEGSGVVHRLVINIITQGLKVMLDWNDTLAGELFDFLCLGLVSKVLILAF